MKPSRRVAQITESMTLAVSARAKAMKAEGVDVVSFGAGEPDFDTPQNIKKAAVDAIASGKTKYTPASGLPELKHAIAEKFTADTGLDCSAAQVIVGCGGKHTLFNAFLATVELGDEVIIPSPYWVSYPEMARFAGGRCVFPEGSEANGFKLMPSQIAEAITPKTRVLVVNSPSNPTGATYTTDELEAIADIVTGKDIWVFSDEIYSELVYDGLEVKSIASLRAGLADQTITFNGVSKTYAMTGWRIGYAVGPADIIKAMGNLQSHSTSNPTSISQYAAIEALTGKQDSIGPMKEEFDHRRIVMWERLSAMPGVTCVRPQGAFYCFPNVSSHYERVLGSKCEGPRSVAFAAKVLADVHVALVPGAAFGDDACVRLSFATSLQQIEKGLERLERFLKP
ncbi:MAG: pyridoxal phosphate-dependent aminotransferase [Planctomycetia bacterium]|nr:pyridoxal phosphate-dependent aminotransferase [Planctomycetia bacterium]